MDDLDWLVHTLGEDCCMAEGAEDDALDCDQEHIRRAQAGEHALDDNEFSLVLSSDDESESEQDETREVRRQTSTLPPVRASI